MSERRYLAPLELGVEGDLAAKRENVVRRDHHTHPTAHGLLHDDVDCGRLELDDEHVRVDRR